MLAVTRCVTCVTGDMIHSVYCLMLIVTRCVTGEIIHSVYLSDADCYQVCDLCDR